MIDVGVISSSLGQTLPTFRFSHCHTGTHLTPIRLYAPSNDGEASVLFRLAGADRFEAFAVIAVLIVAYIALKART